MDPNKVLERARRAYQLMGQPQDSYTAAEWDAAAAECAQALEDLDTWLSKGGFLPDAWKGSAVQADIPHAPECDDGEDTCDTCGGPNPDGGDGYDGNCATCADKAEAR